jgi:hypothetical protein
MQSRFRDWRFLFCLKVSSQWNRSRSSCRPAVIFDRVDSELRSMWWSSLSSWLLGERSYIVDVIEDSHVARSHAVLTSITPLRSAGGGLRCGNLHCHERRSGDGGDQRSVQGAAAGQWSNGQTNLNWSTVARLTVWFTVPPGRSIIDVAEAVDLLPRSAV